MSLFVTDSSQYKVLLVYLRRLIQKCLSKNSMRLQMNVATFKTIFMRNMVLREERETDPIRGDKWRRQLKVNFINY